jgi:hypothetical protein
MHPRMESKKSLKIDCDGKNDCTVTVTVKCDWFDGCDVSVDYDLVLVKNARNDRVDITWQLDGPDGAEFPSNGVVVNSSDFECKPKEQKNQFRCTDKHSGFDVVKYTINVTVPNHGVPSLDPWIVNN